VRIGGIPKEAVSFWGRGVHAVRGGACVGECAVAWSIAAGRDVGVNFKKEGSIMNACAMGGRREAGVGARTIAAALIALSGCAGAASAQNIAFNPGPGERLLQLENTPAFNAQVAISVGFDPGEMAAISFLLPSDVQAFRLKRAGLLWTSYGAVLFESPNTPTVQDGYEVYAGRFRAPTTSNPVGQVPGPLLYSSFPVQLADAQPPAQAAFSVTQLVDDFGQFPSLNRPADGYITVGLRFDSAGTGGAPAGNTFASSVCYAVGGVAALSPIQAVPSGAPGSTPPGWQAYPQSGRTLILRLIIEPVTPTPTACNPADIANTDGDAGPDGAVNNGDFVLFFQAFFSPEGSPAQLVADIANTDGDIGSDGLVNNGDFNAFFAAFFTPCP
jgi:hypothetical protein